MRLRSRAGSGGCTMNNLAESVAVELLKRDGAMVIWQAHLTAAKAQRDGDLRAAEILLKIADAAEEAVRRGPRQ